jgi:thiol:disulfide interchange protein DsbD
MRSRRVLTLAALALAALAAGEPQQPADEAPRAMPGAATVAPVKARLITQHAAIQPGGTTRAGVRFTLEPGWHIYAQDPGDAGLPTRIKWSATEPAVIGPMSWPLPQEFLDPGDIRTFGYADSVILSSPLTLPAGPTSRAGASIHIRAEVSWLACQEICIPGGTTLELDLPVIPGPPAPSPDAAFFKMTGG